MSSELAIDFFAGSLGGVAGILAGHPFDTVKVRLQTQSPTDASAALRYKGNTFSTVAEIARLEGVRGLYKGLSSPLASVAFLNAIIFSTHNHVLKWQQRAQNPAESLSLSSHFIAGAAAGSLQALLASPMELLKLRVQTQAVPVVPSFVTMATLYGPIVVVDGAPGYGNMVRQELASPYRCFKHIVETKGLRALTRGLGATTLRDFSGVGAYFAFYELITRKLSNSDVPLNSIQLLLAGGLAGTISWLCNYPVDVVKTRFQANDRYDSYAQVCRILYAERGWRAFFIGLESTLIRAFPTNAATFLTVEWVYRMINASAAAAASPQSIPAIQDHFPTSSLVRSYSANPTKSARSYVTVHDLWSRNSFLLPEAGSTLIDPMVVRYKQRCPPPVHIVL